MIKIDVIGPARITDVLNTVNAALNTTHILDESAALLLARNRARYLREVNPDEQAWPKSQAAIRRAKSGRGGGTLFRTGKMFHSIQLARSTSSERFIGTDVPYAPLHMHGTIKYPARVFLGANEDDLSMINRLVIKRVKDGLAGLQIAWKALDEGLL